MNKKVLLLTNILSPYRVPLFNILSKVLNKKGIKFKVVFMAENEHNREWRIRKDELEVDYTVLPGWHHFIWKYELPIHINWSIWKSLRQESPDVIISGGYSYLSNWFALIYCKLLHKKLILWTGTTPESVKGKCFLRSGLRKTFIKNCNAFVTYGERSADFLNDSGIDSNSIFIGCNVGDVDFFRKAVAAYRMGKDFQKEKSKFSAPLLLYVGQLIPRKGILQLIAALSELKSQPWHLLIVGNGPLRQTIEERLRINQINDRVHLIGFQDKEKLVKFYALADIFVFPSLLDPFGIVVSESLASGLFTITSKYAGASWDLIKQGENGLIIDSKNIEELRSAIIKAIDIVSNRDFSREKIVRSIEHLTPTSYAQAFVKAIEYVMSR